jgi:maleate isomerase
MWQLDGWDAHVRIGVLVPHADVGPESELRAMAPGDVSIHAARVRFGAMASGGAMDPTIPLAPVKAFAEPPHVDDAVELLAAAPLHAIGYGFTSSAYVIGVDGERAMLERLQKSAGDIAVVATGAALVSGLGALGVTRIAAFDPPWFDAELTSLGRAYYGAAGFDVVASASCELPSGQALIQPAALYEWVRTHAPDDAEAVVLGGNGFRAVGVIDALETALARPVLTANQALFWAALRAAGRPHTPVEGYGQLFRQAVQSVH